MARRATELGYEVRVDQNRLTAWAIIYAHAKPEQLDAEQLVQDANEQQIIITDALRGEIQAAIDAFTETRSEVQRVIARATPPKHGEHGRIEWIGEIADLMAKDPHAPDETGRVDFYNSKEYICVATGQHVANIIPPVEGEPGADVTGRPLQPRTGKPIELRIDKTLSVDDAGRIVSQEDGVLDLTPLELRVIRLLHVRNHVDFNTGNIDFQGSVRVNQDVRDRFVLKASEDVMVHGLVEAATIVTGRNFVCPRGMAARDRGELHVGGDAEVGYLNNVRGQVGGNLAVRRELINCELLVGGDLIGPQCAVIGGELAVTGSIRVGTLGAKGGPRTTLILGEMPLLSAQIDEIEQHRGEYMRRFAERQELYAGLTQAGARLTDRDRARLKQVREEMVDLHERVKACDARRKELEASAGRTAHVNVAIGAMIHPKVIFRAFGQIARFDGEVRGPLTIGLDESGQLQYRQSGGGVQPLGQVARIVRPAA